MPGIVARHTSFFVLVGVLLAQLFLLSIQVTRDHNVRVINAWAAELFGPCERGFHDVIQGVAGSWAAVHDLWEYKQSNKELGSELVLARAQIQELSARAAEVDRLKALLDFKTRSPYRSVAAQVIAASPEDGSATVVIDRGQDVGLKADLPVITPQGVVGKVAAVYAHTSQVLMITDPTCGVGCLLEKSRIQGILKGSRQDLCELQYVMDDQKVSAGEAVVTSGLDQIYPKGLLVGYVVRAEQGNIYQHIAVKPAASLDRLEDVLILMESTPGQSEASNQGRP